MSHELRTPLNHILGFTEMVVDQKLGSLEPNQSAYLENVLQSGRHLLLLINDILDLSKVESGKMEIEANTFDLGSLIKNSLLMIKEKAMKHGFQIQTSIDDKVPENITADERKLKQIFYNLLSNAVKFTPDRGQIQLCARISGNGDHGKMIEFSVKDSGIGIKEEDIERIFSPFEQADGSPSRKYLGTGLGLSLTERFVNLHGGKIWVESEGEGRGSTFRFTIPMDINI